MIRISRMTPWLLCAVATCACASDIDDSLDEASPELEIGAVEQAATNVTSVHQDVFYGGAYAVALPTGDYKLPALESRGVRNDDISSVKVTSGYMTALFEHDDFAYGKFGKMLLAYSNTPTLVPQEFNDITSSIVVVSSANHQHLSRSSNGVLYTLKLLNSDARVPSITWSRVTNCWFSRYYQMVERFKNPNAPKDLLVVIGANENQNNWGPGRIYLSGEGLSNNPYDADVMTHEQFHAVQSGYQNAPGWATEGLADYARYKYGIYNAQGGWKLPSPPISGSYKDGYRNTARFFLWLEKKKRASFPTDLHAACLAGYTDGFWAAKFSGKTVDQLWAEYVANPAL